MKYFLFLLVILCCSAQTFFSQCDAEPALNTDSVLLKTITVNRTIAAETGLAIKASVANASWEKPGAEGAVVSVFIDGKYNQDAILFAGDRVFEYRVLLGELSAGKHKIDIVLNEERSAKNVGAVKISSAKLIDTKPDATDHIAVANAPFIYHRPEVIDKFSDIPLLTFYEILPDPSGATKIRYTTIFTNEDGGTQSTALMARWGRATDIEWVYEILVKNGKITSATIQGRNHVTENFAGQKVFGAHPLIYNVTVNNNFASTGCSTMRMAPMPVRADLSQASREAAMDQNPWTYRIMTEEMMREGRVDPKNLGVNVIDDPRNYLYVDVVIEIGDIAASVEAVDKSGKIYRSDHGDPRLRVSRIGHQRIAVHFPHPLSKLASLTMACFTKDANAAKVPCGQSRVTGYISLEKNFARSKKKL